jgi:hypothetical protein
VHRCDRTGGACGYVRFSYAASREAWPEAEPSGRKSCWRKPQVECRQASAPASGGRRKPPYSVARPARRLRAGNTTMRLPAFRYPFICRFFLRHCRARPGNPCERKARSDLPIRLSEPQFSMDHRVKPGGDEEFCKTRAQKKTRRENEIAFTSPRWGEVASVSERVRGDRPLRCAPPHRPRELKVRQSRCIASATVSRRTAAEAAYVPLPTGERGRRQLRKGCLT